MAKQRIQWIDAVKAFGIFSIYLGHFAEDAGRSYWFVFLYHVPLFFFVAGCTESFNKETSLWVNIKKKIVNLYIPFLMFAVCSAALFMIENDGNPKTAKILLHDILLGCVRNSFIAGSLWFLSCMFTMCVVFQLIKKLHFRTAILLACIVIFIFTKQAALNPKWAFNLDSALAYMIFYCLGYLLFGNIDRLLNTKSIAGRVFLWAGTAASFIYAVYFFFGICLLEPLNIFPVAEMFGLVLKTAPLIWLNIVAAYVFRSSAWLNRIGQNTLYLCGSEYIVRSIVQQTFLLAGIELKAATPLGAYIYAFFLLILANTFFVPVEKRIVAAYTSAVRSAGCC